MTTTNHIAHCTKGPTPWGVSPGVSTKARYPCTGTTGVPVLEYQSQWEPLTQAPGRVCPLSDRAWLLNQGRVEFDDSDLDLVEMETLRAEFPGAVE